MQEMEVLGIVIKDRTLREQLDVANYFLGSNVLEVISCVTMEDLIRASSQEDWRQWLESLDLAVCADEEILRAAGITDRNRLREVAHNGFLRAFLRQLAKGTVPIYLLSETEKQLRALEKGLIEQQWNLLVAGRGSLEDYGQDLEKLINAANGVAPKAILSNFSYPAVMDVISAGRPLINGEIWLQIPPDALPSGGSDNAFKRLQKRLVRKYFHRQVSSYTQEND